MTNTANPTNTTESSISMADPLWAGVRSTSGAEGENKARPWAEARAGTTPWEAQPLHTRGMVSPGKMQGIYLQGVCHTAGIWVPLSLSQPPGCSSWPAQEVQWSNWRHSPWGQTAWIPVLLHHGLTTWSWTHLMCLCGKMRKTVRISSAFCEGQMS